MTRKVRIFSVALIVAFAYPLGIGLPSTPSPTSSQVERLAALGKLWGMINLCSALTASLNAEGSKCWRTWSSVKRCPHSSHVSCSRVPVYPATADRSGP